MSVHTCLSPGKERQRNEEEVRGESFVKRKSQGNYQTSATWWDNSPVRIPGQKIKDLTVYHKAIQLKPHLSMAIIHGLSVTISLLQWVSSLRTGMEKCILGDLLHIFNSDKYLNAYLDKTNCPWSPCPNIRNTVGMLYYIAFFCPIYSYTGLSSDNNIFGYKYVSNNSSDR